MKNIIKKLQKDKENLKSIIEAMQKRNYINALHCCVLHSDIFDVDFKTVEHELLGNIFYDISNKTNYTIPYAKGVLKVVEQAISEME